MVKTESYDILHQRIHNVPRTAITLVTGSWIAAGTNHYQDIKTDGSFLFMKLMFFFFHRSERHITPQDRLIVSINCVTQLRFMVSFIRSFS